MPATPGRSVSVTFREAVQAVETQEVALLLMRLEEETIPYPGLLFVDNPTSISSDLGGDLLASETFIPMHFRVDLPVDDGQNPGEMSITIDNIDALIGEAVANAVLPTISVYLVLASSPDTVEAGPWVFTFESATVTPQAVTGQAASADGMMNEYPAFKRTAFTVPGIA